MKKLITFLCISSVTVIAIGIFTYTFVRAAVYAPSDSASIPVQQSESSTPRSPSKPAVSSAKTSATTKKVAQKSAAPAKPKVEVEHPTKLEIPTLKIKANVQSVGMNPQGNIATPNNFTDVAWYMYGSLPGNPGNAIIDGHVNNGLSLPGIFAHLEDLKVGDDIYVTISTGKKVHFKVNAITIYAHDKVPMEILESSGEARLRLITCAGDWIGSSKTYTQRLVVTATVVE